MDDNFQVNTESVSTAPSGSDSTPAASTGSTSSNSEPQTAQSLVDSYFAEQSASSSQPSQEPASAAPVEADPETTSAQEADSAASGETELDPNSLSKEQAWEHVRGLREIKKTLEPKAKAYDSVLGQLEQAGLTPEILEPGVSLLSGLLSVTEDGQSTTEPFLSQLHEASEPRLAQLLTDAARMYPGYLVGQLGREAAMQSLGLNPNLYDTYRAVQPDGSLNGQTVGGYDPDVLASIPDHLRDTYRSLDLDDQLELDGMTAERRAAKLQREHEWKTLQQRDQQRDEAAAQAQAQAREQAQEQRLQQFIAEQETSFYNELKHGFSPFGNAPEDAELTGFFHDAVYSHVTKSLNGNPKVASALNALAVAVKQGDTLAQSQLMAQVNVQVAKARNGIVTRLNERIFGQLQGKAQAARVNASNQINVNGQGGFSADRQPSQLPNINSPDYYEALMERAGIRF